MTSDHPLIVALPEYVRAVAHALGIPHDGTSWEVSDTATAYLALPTAEPHLMLLWSERHGWAVTEERDAAAVLSQLDGDMVPAPATVAAFVRDTLAGGPAPARRPSPRRDSRQRLAERMALHRLAPASGG